MDGFGIALVAFCIVGTVVLLLIAWFLLRLAGHTIGDVFRLLRDDDDTWDDAARYRENRLRKRQTQIPDFDEALARHQDGNPASLPYEPLDWADEEGELPPISDRRLRNRSDEAEYEIYDDEDFDSPDFFG